MKYHYAIIIVFCCFLFTGVTIGFVNAAFGIYQPYIVALPFVGNTGNSILNTIRLITSSAFLLFVDRLYAKLGMRVSVLLATLAGAAAFFFYSIGTSFPLLLIGAIFAGASFGMGGMVAVTILVNRWLETHRGLAIGFASVGTSLANMTIPLLVVAIIQSDSLWSAFRLQSMIAAGIALIVFVLLRNKPQDMGLKPFVGIDKKKRSHTTVRFHARPLTKGERALLHAAVAGVGGFCMSTTTYITVYLVMSGYDEGFVAALIMGGAAVLLSVKLLGGHLFDRVGGLWATTIFFIVMICGTIIVIATGSIHSPALVFAGYCIMVGGMLIGTLGISEWSMDLAPRGNLATFAKNLQVAFVIGGVIMNFVPGPLADLFGSYQILFFIDLGLAAFALFALRTVYKRARDKDAKTQ